MTRLYDEHELDAARIRNVDDSEARVGCDPSDATEEDESENDGAVNHTASDLEET